MVRSISPVESRMRISPERKFARFSAYLTAVPALEKQAQHPALRRLSSHFDTVFPEVLPFPARARARTRDKSGNNNLNAGCPSDLFRTRTRTRLQPAIRSPPKFQVLRHPRPRD